MSLHHNPRIVTDGLVLAYDMDNAAKSWKGKPTENLASSNFFDGNVNFTTDETIQDTLPTGKTGDVRYLNADYVVDPNRTGSIGSYTLTAGDTYTLSFYVKNINCTGFGGNLYSPTLTTSIGSITYPAVFTDRWTRVTKTFTIPTDTVSAGGNVVMSPQVFRDGGNGFFKLSMLQLEEGTFVTPFVNGTRSNTQALLDMSKSENTITATSLTYNSDGTFEFDNNNYLSLNTGITGSNFTVLMWHYNGASSFATAGHRTFLSTNNLRFQWDDTPDRGPFVDFNSGSGGGQANFGSSLTPANFLQKYTMVGLVGGSTVKTTFNGVTSGQSSTISATRNFSSNGNVSIGIDNLSGIGGSDHINREGSVVKMPLIQIYDRALTEAEIKQNFNATRGRFGI